MSIRKIILKISLIVIVDNNSNCGYGKRRWFPGGCSIVYNKICCHHEFIVVQFFRNPNVEEQK